MRIEILLIVLAIATVICGTPAGVTFVPSAESVDSYDFVEVTVNVEEPDVGNPFTDASIEGHFAPAGEEPVKVDGFCDSTDGRVFRIRFMPTKAGDHSYSVIYRQGPYQATYKGKFTARDTGRRGLIRVDENHPWHFLWEGTGEHYFWNGTTTYWLLGWDDQNIRTSIDRLHKLKVNRLRTAIHGRVKNGRAWFENVFPTDEFRFILNPWVAQRPESVEDPGFDVTRFNLPHWCKIERMLRHAGEKDMAISTRDVDGDPSNWEDSFRLALGNELSGDRPWRGELHRVALYARVLDSGEIAESAKAGQAKAPAGPVMLYDFREGAGQVVKDTSGAGAPVDLQVKDASAVQWLDGGGLRITGSTLIAAAEPGTKLIEAVMRSKALTIEAWIKPANITQAGPARIVTLSKDPSSRNFTLGQKADAYEVRFRTTVTSPNGEPALSSPGGDETIPPVVGLRPPEGDLAVLYFSAGGAAKIKAGGLADGLKAQWFNPRSGQWSSADPDEHGNYVAPDGQDWTLLRNDR